MVQGASYPGTTIWIQRFRHELQVKCPLSFRVALVIVDTASDALVGGLPVVAPVISW